MTQLGELLIVENQALNTVRLHSGRNTGSVNHKRPYLAIWADTEKGLGFIAWVNR